MTRNDPRAGFRRSGPAPAPTWGHGILVNATASVMLEHRHTTIDGKYLPGDIGCVIARQE